MSVPIQVVVCASDPISRAGITSALGFHREVRVVGEEAISSTDPLVAVVVVDDVDNEALHHMRRLQRSGPVRTILIATHLDGASLLAAVEAGVCGVLRRSEASAEHLITVIGRAAAGDGTVPPDLLGRLLEQIGQLQRKVLTPRGLSLSGLTDRESQVLRLVSEGYDTSQIALHLSCSERTIKNVLHDVAARLQVRNRAHAVAYALKAGFI